MTFAKLSCKKVKRRGKKSLRIIQPSIADVRRARLLEQENQVQELRKRDEVLINKKIGDLKREIELSKKRFEKETRFLNSPVTFKRNRSLNFQKMKSETNFVAKHKNFHTICSRLSKDKKSKENINVTQKSLKIGNTAEKLKFVETCDFSNAELHNLSPKVQNENNISDVHSVHCKIVANGYSCESSCNINCTEKQFENEKILSKIETRVNECNAVINSGKLCAQAPDMEQQCPVVRSLSEHRTMVLTDMPQCNNTGIEFQNKESNKNYSENDVGKGCENYFVESWLKPDLKDTENAIQNFEKDTTITKNNLKFFQEKLLELSLKQQEKNCRSRHKSFDFTAEECVRAEKLARLKKELIALLWKKNVHSKHKNKTFCSNHSGEVKLPEFEAQDKAVCVSKNKTNLELLRTSWQTWREFTLRSLEQAKMERLLKTLAEYKKKAAEQYEKHCSEKLQKCTVKSEQKLEGKQSMALGKKAFKHYKESSNNNKILSSRNLKGLKTQATRKSVNKRISATRSRKQQLNADNKDQQIRELSAERKARELALLQEKEEMNIKPAGNIPLWVLHPPKLIASESLKRSQQRQEAIKLRLEAKRLQDEQKIAAERIRQEKELERLEALHELVSVRYKQRVAQRLLMKPMYLLLAERRRKESQAVEFAQQLLLHKYWNAWKKFVTFRIMSAQQFADRLRMRTVFHAMMQVRADAVRKQQVAEDFFFNLVLPRQVFRAWKHYTMEQLVKAEEAVQVATQYYHRKLLQQCMTRWMILKEERERQKRLEVWRMRVREILPDFMPPS